MNFPTKTDSEEKRLHNLKDITFHKQNTTQIEEAFECERMAHCMTREII